MTIARSLSEVLSLIFLFLLSESAFVDNVVKERTLNYWNLTRDSDVVIKGTITNIDTNISMAVSSIYKGDNIPKIISFAAPSAQKNLYSEYFSRLKIEEKYIVFLQQNGIDKYELIDVATGDIKLINLVKQVILDVLKLDSLNSDLDKCKMLISLMSPYKDLRSYHAYTELLQKYNKADFFELFEPLEHEPLMQICYISLMEKNPHPSATIKLRELLQQHLEDHILSQVITSLKGKNPQDNELSKEILQYLSHDNPNIRRAVIYTLHYRGFSEALPEVMKLLDDEAPLVRASALSFVGKWVEEPEILMKIKHFTSDKDKAVRAEAYHVLLRDSSRIKGILFYKFLLASLFDKSERVRRIASRLDLSWERMPFRISLLLLWPSIVLTGFVFYIQRNIRWSQRIKIIIKGVVSGYLSGAIAGFFIGLYHSQNPIFHSIILIPPLFIPVGILLSVGVSKFGWKRSVTTFFLFIVFMIVIIYIITSCNTLWPCILIGSILLGTIIYYQKSALMLPGNNQKQR